MVLLVLLQTQKLIIGFAAFCGGNLNTQFIDFMVQKLISDLQRMKGLFELFGFDF